MGCKWVGGSGCVWGGQLRTYLGCLRGSSTEQCRPSPSLHALRGHGARRGAPPPASTSSPNPPPAPKPQGLPSGGGKGGEEEGVPGPTELEGGSSEIPAAPPGGVCQRGATGEERRGKGRWGGKERG